MKGCSGRYTHVVLGASLMRVSTVTGLPTGEMVTVLARHDSTGWVSVEGWRFGARQPTDAVRWMVPIESLARALTTPLIHDELPV